MTKNLINIRLQAQITFLIVANTVIVMINSSFLDIFNDGIGTGSRTPMHGMRLRFPAIRRCRYMAVCTGLEPAIFAVTGQCLTLLDQHTIYKVLLFHERYFLFSGAVLIPYDMSPYHTFIWSNMRDSNPLRRFGRPKCYPLTPMLHNSGPRLRNRTVLINATN